MNKSQLSKLERSVINENGAEILNPNPIVVYLDSELGEAQDDRIRRIIQETISRHMYDQGYESIEESTDFDIEDEFDSDLPLTEYEEMEDEPWSRDFVGGTKGSDDKSGETKTNDNKDIGEQPKDADAPKSDTPLA